MRTMTWAAWRETITAMAVVVSLGFVAYEIRQNTRAVESQTLQALAQQAAELSLAGVANPELRAASAKARDGDYSDLSASEMSALYWFYAASMRLAENRFLQYEIGAISREHLDALGAQMPIFESPYFAVWWKGRRDTFGDTFVEYVEREILPQSRVPAGNRLPLVR